MPTGKAGRIAKIGGFYTTIQTNDRQVKVPNGQMTRNLIKVLNDAPALVGRG